MDDELGPRATIAQCSWIKKLREDSKNTLETLPDRESLLWCGRKSLHPGKHKRCASPHCATLNTVARTTSAQHKSQRTQDGRGLPNYLSASLFRKLRRSRKIPKCSGIMKCYSCQGFGNFPGKENGSSTMGPNS